MMRHGRDHDERQLKVRTRRRNPLLPEEAELEAERPASASRGAEVAPTATAERRERERHRRERRMGRIAAGLDSNPRDRRDPALGRADLERAAAEADRAVAGRELSRRSRS